MTARVYLEIKGLSPGFVKGLIKLQEHPYGLGWGLRCLRFITRRLGKFAQNLLGCFTTQFETQIKL